MIENFVKILEFLGDRLEVCVSVFIDRWNSSVTHDIAKNRQLLRI